MSFISRIMFHSKKMAESCVKFKLKNEYIYIPITIKILPKVVQLLHFVEDTTYLVTTYRLMDLLCARTEKLRLALKYTLIKPKKAIFIRCLFCIVNGHNIGIEWNVQISQKTYDHSPTSW